MNVKPYTPQAGSLAAQVIGFFANNRDEHLTLDDISDKFDAVRGNIHTILRTAIEAGLLIRSRNDDGDYIYKRGANAAPPPAPKADSKSTGASRARSLRKNLDLDALKVEDGVPYMQEARTGSKWDAMFDKLSKPGLSVEIPADCKSAVAAAALNRNKRKKGQFKVALTSSTKARVWRVA